MKQGDAAGAVDKDKAKQKQKELAAKKRKALLEKMKKKQSNFMAPSSSQTAASVTTASTNSSALDSTKLGTTPEVSSFAEPDTPINDETEGVFSNQSCASCQEPLEVENFFKRPFAQLCYLQSSKLFYHTCYQTIESQKQSLKNLRDAQTFDDPKVASKEPTNSF